MVPEFREPTAKGYDVLNITVLGDDIVEQNPQRFVLLEFAGGSFPNALGQRLPKIIHEDSKGAVYLFDARV